MSSEECSCNVFMKDADCNCCSEEEHRALVRSVDESYIQDPIRHKMRTDRNTFALRAAIISESNGYHPAR